MFVHRIKKFFITIAKVTISVIVLWFLVHSAQIKLELLTSFFHHPILFIAVILAFFLMILLSAWRWQILNSIHGIHLDYYHTTVAAYIGGAFNYLLPGSIGGDVVRLYYVFKNAPQKKSHALLAIFSDRILGFMAVFITILFVAGFRMPQFSQEPEIFYLLAICIAFCISILLAFVMCMWLPQRINLGSRLHKRFGHKNWIKPIVSFLNTISISRFEKAVVIKCLIISVLVQLLIVGTVMLLGRMMDLPSITFSDYVITMGVTQIVNLIPITPGGVGIGEMAFANMLLLLNPGSNAAYATIFFAYRVITIFTYLPGIIWYISKSLLFKKNGQFQEKIVQV